MTRPSPLTLGFGHLRWEIVPCNKVSIEAIKGTLIVFCVLSACSLCVWSMYAAGSVFSTFTIILNGGEDLVQRCRVYSWIWHISQPLETFLSIISFTLIFPFNCANKTVAQFVFTTAWIHFALNLSVTVVQIILAADCRLMEIVLSPQKHPAGGIIFVVVLIEVSLFKTLVWFGTFLKSTGLVECCDRPSPSVNTILMRGGRDYRTLHNNYQLNERPQRPGRRPVRDNPSDQPQPGPSLCDLSSSRFLNQPETTDPVHSAYTST